MICFIIDWIPKNILLKMVNVSIVSSLFHSGCTSAAPGKPAK